MEVNDLALCPVPILIGRQCDLFSGDLQRNSHTGMGDAFFERLRQSDDRNSQYQEYHLKILSHTLTPSPRLSRCDIGYITSGSLSILGHIGVLGMSGWNPPVDVVLIGDAKLCGDYGPLPSTTEARLSECSSPCWVQQLLFY